MGYVIPSCLICELKFYLGICFIIIVVVIKNLNCFCFSRKRKKKGKQRNKKDFPFTFLEFKTALSLKAVYNPVEVLFN